MASKTSDKIALLDACKQEQCELIDSRRVRIICKGEVGKPHRPAFLFSEQLDREFLNHHLVSSFHCIIRDFFKKK